MRLGPFWGASNMRLRRAWVLGPFWGLPHGWYTGLYAAPTAVGPLPWVLGACQMHLWPLLGPLGVGALLGPSFLLSEEHQDAFGHVLRLLVAS